jgi:hypothetical protein
MEAIHLITSKLDSSQFLNIMQIPRRIMLMRLVQEEKNNYVSGIKKQKISKHIYVCTL